MTEVHWKRDFFDLVEPIRLRDPLAEVLGAVEEGDPLVYTYADAVKLAGHSCPAVSGAFLITSKALKALYGDELPVRGEVRVAVMGGPADMAYGPISQVISLITGASGETGFRGLGGRFGRGGLLKFHPDKPQFNTFYFQRTDSGRTVKVSYDPSSVPQEGEMGALMPKVIQGTAAREERERFQSMWQGRVEEILLNNERYDQLLTVEEVDRSHFPE